MKREILEEKEVDFSWMRPTEFVIHNDVKRVLLNSIEEHLKYLNTKFSNQFINNDKIEEKYNVVGEFVDTLDGELCIIKGMKSTKLTP
jgi:hypothetical protein